MRPCILIVEDNGPDLLLIQEALAAAEIVADVEIARDGEQATAFLDRAERDPEAPAPRLVILDINLPRKPGDEVLRHMRQSTRSRSALVLVVSTSDASKDRERMISLGADFYFRKPSDYDSFMKLGGIVRHFLSNAARGA